MISNGELKLISFVRVKKDNFTFVKALWRHQRSVALQEVLGKQPCQLSAMSNVKFPVASGD